MISLEDFTCFSALSYDITIVYRKYFPKTESTFLSLVQDKILLLGSKAAFGCFTLVSACDLYKVLAG